MEELLERITRPILFYLPRYPLELIVEKSLKSFDTIGLTNSLVAVDKNGNMKYLTSGSEVLILLEKEKILKQNVLELLKAKESQENTSFNYLKSNYLKELDAWIKTTKIFKERARIDTQNYIKEIQGYLVLQHRLLKEHQNELQRYFEDPYQINTTEIIVGDKKSKIQKIQLISEKEVDNYLMTHVFNLDSNRFNNKS